MRIGYLPHLKKMINRSTLIPDVVWWHDVNLNEKE